MKLRLNAARQRRQNVAHRRKVRLAVRKRQVLPAAHNPLHQQPQPVVRNLKLKSSERVGSIAYQR